MYLHSRGLRNQSEGHDSPTKSCNEPWCCRRKDDTESNQGQGPEASRVGLRGQRLANCERNLSRCDTDLRPLTPDLCLRHSADVPPAQVASRRRHDSRRDGGATPLGQSADVGLSGGCFGKHGNHFAIERGKVIRFAAGDQLAIANDFLVFPVRSGVLQVGLERRP